MPSLFDIRQDLHAIREATTAGDGAELSPELAATLDAWFADAMSDQGEKLDGYVNLLRLIEAEELAAATEAKRYREIQQQRTKATEALERRLIAHFEATGQTRAKTPTGRTVVIQKAGGKVSLELDSVPVESLDARFVETVPAKLVPCGESIRAALAAGESLPFARLLPRKTLLVVK